MNRFFVLFYGLACYIISFVTLLYLFGFAGDVLVPKSVSGGESAAGFPSAMFINLFLIALFGVQHSVMARPSFKKKWTQFVPKPVERSTFVLVTSLIFIAMFLTWQPMPEEIWNLSGTPFTLLLWFAFFLGVAVVFASSFMINHFDLFGLRQVFLYFQGRPYIAVPFQVKGFYRWVRHPLMTGFLLVFWAAPVMTTGRLLFAVGMTVYILIGTWFEERNLAESLGEPYMKYRTRTSRIFPLFRKFQKGKQ